MSQLNQRVSRTIARRWRAIDETSREPYEEMAKEDRHHYMLACQMHAKMIRGEPTEELPPRPTPAALMMRIKLPQPQPAASASDAKKEKSPIKKEDAPSSSPVEPAPVSLPPQQLFVPPSKQPTAVVAADTAAAPMQQEQELEQTSEKEDPETERRGGDGFGVDDGSINTVGLMFPTRRRARTTAAAAPAADSRHPAVSTPEVPVCKPLLSPGDEGGDEVALPSTRRSGRIGLKRRITALTKDTDPAPEATSSGSGEQLHAHSDADAAADDAALMFPLKTEAGGVLQRQVGPPQQQQQQHHLPPPLQPSPQASPQPSPSQQIMMVRQPQQQTQITIAAAPRGMILDQETKAGGMSGHQGDQGYYPQQHPAFLGGEGIQDQPPKLESGRYAEQQPPNSFMNSQFHLAGDVSRNADLSQAATADEETKEISSEPGKLPIQQQPDGGEIAGASTAKTDTHINVTTSPHHGKVDKSASFGGANAQVNSATSSSNGGKHKRKRVEKRSAIRAGNGRVELPAALLARDISKVTTMHDGGRKSAMNMQLAEANVGRTGMVIAVAASFDRPAMNPYFPTHPHHHPSAYNHPAMQVSGDLQEPMFTSSVPVSTHPARPMADQRGHPNEMRQHHQQHLLRQMPQPRRYPAMQHLPPGGAMGLPRGGMMPTVRPPSPSGRPSWINPNVGVASGMQPQPVGGAGVGAGRDLSNQPPPEAGEPDDAGEAATVGHPMMGEMRYHRVGPRVAVGIVPPEQHSSSRGAAPSSRFRKSAAAAVAAANMERPPRMMMPQHPEQLQNQQQHFPPIEHRASPRLRGPTAMGMADSQFSEHPLLMQQQQEQQSRLMNGSAEGPGRYEGVMMEYEPASRLPAAPEEITRRSRRKRTPSKIQRMAIEGDVEGDDDNGGGSQGRLGHGGRKRKGAEGRGLFPESSSVIRSMGSGGGGTGEHETSEG